MNNTKQKIQCPKCGESISIDDVLTHQIEEKIKKDFEIKQKIKEAELEQKEADLKKQADTLATSKKEIDSVVAKQVNDKMSEERLKLYKDAKTEAEKEQSAKTALLEEQLKNKEEKLAQGPGVIPILRLTRWIKYLETIGVDPRQVVNSSRENFLAFLHGNSETQTA